MPCDAAKTVFSVPIITFDSVLQILFLTQFIDTDRILCGRVYKMVGCLFICLSVPAWATALTVTATNFAAVGLVGGRY